MKKNKLIHNSFSGLLQVILTALLAFISVPIFINKLGLEVYGTFAIVSIVGNLNSLANFGLNGALMIYISKQGKGKQSNNDIIATIIFMFLVILIVSFIMLTFRDFILVKIFAIPEAHFIEASLLFRLLIVSNAILLFGQTGTAIIDACQKVYISNIIQFIYSLLYWGGIIVVILMGGRLYTIGMVILFSSILWFGLISYSVFKIWGRLDFSKLFSAFLPSIKKQLAYGSKIYFTGIIAFLFEPLSKILLSNFVNINAVGIFEIGFKIKTQINSLIAKSLYPLLPFIASKGSTNEFKHRLYDFSTKIQIFIMPFSVILFFCFPYLINLWLGDNNSNEATVFVSVMTISMLLFSPSKIPIYQFLLANNRAGKTFLIQLSSVIVNIAFFFLFLSKYGQYSILISNSLAFLSSYIICSIFQIIYFNISWKVILYQELNFLVIFVLLIIPSILVNKLIPSGVIDLLVYPIITYLAFLIINKKFRLFNKKDSQYYFGTLGKFDFLFRKIFWIQ
ncbi:MAG: oligosaccharide flippase family protein [Mobilitalea sp.]